MEITVFWVWLLLTFAAGKIASLIGRSFVKTVIVSIIFSPIIGIIVALMLGPKDKAE